nr:hypothetical protein Iba_chr02dCG2880 [Ipomoea batatas]
MQEGLLRNVNCVLLNQNLLLLGDALLLRCFWRRGFELGVTPSLLRFTGRPSRLQFGGRPLLDSDDLSGIGDSDDLVALVGSSIVVLLLYAMLGLIKKEEDDEGLSLGRTLHVCHQDADLDGIKKFGICAPQASYLGQAAVDTQNQSGT